MGGPEPMARQMYAQPDVMNAVSTEVAVSREISVEAFPEENVLKRKPILIRGALKEWRALQWTSEYPERVARSQTLSYRTEDGVMSLKCRVALHPCLRFVGSYNRPWPRAVS